MVSALVASTEPSLANTSFYQAAAGVLVVLLITGVVAELRTTRERLEQSQASRRQDRGFLFFLVLSGVVLAGELATFTVLLRGQASGFFQATVGASLIIGLIGIPGLVIYDVIDQMPATDGVRRGGIRAAVIGGVVALGLVAALGIESLLTGKPAVGSATKATTTAGQIEQGNIVRASLSGAPGGSFTDPLIIRRNAQIVVAIRLSNAGPDEVKSARVTAHLPSVSGEALAVTIDATSSEINPTRSSTQSASRPRVDGRSASGMSQDPRSNERSRARSFESYPTASHTLESASGRSVSRLNTREPSRFACELSQCQPLRTAPAVS